MDHQPPVFGELKHDDLEQVARAIRADREDLRRVGVGVQVEPAERVVDRVSQILLRDTMLEG